jgi:DNA uptake protein ComE-like DNA-binding protein
MTKTNDFDLDLNTASLEELERLPVLGRYRAQALIDARPFTAWEQVAHVEGIGRQALEDLRNGGARIGDKAA